MMGNSWAMIEPPRTMAWFQRAWDPGLETVPTCTPFCGETFIPDLLLAMSFALISSSWLCFSEFV